MSLQQQAIDALPVEIVETCAEYCAQSSDPLPPLYVLHGSCVPCTVGYYTAEDCLRALRDTLFYTDRDREEEIRFPAGTMKKGNHGRYIYTVSPFDSYMADGLDSWIEQTGAPIIEIRNLADEYYHEEDAIWVTKVVYKDIVRHVPADWRESFAIPGIVARIIATERELHISRYQGHIVVAYDINKLPRGCLRHKSPTSGHWYEYTRL